MTDIKFFTLEKLNSELQDLQLPKFRAAQIFKWLHEKGVSSFDEMTNLNSDLKQMLKQRYFISSCTVEDKYVSAIDGTVKYLFNRKFQ